MLTEVYSNIYKLEIPLPNSPLKAINSYIIVSEDRNLVVDTGFNRKECKEAFMEGIKELNLELEKTDLFVTHLHSDHCGLAVGLSNEGAKVYTGKVDGKTINEMCKVEYWEKFNEWNKIFGLERDNLSFNEHPGYKYCPKEPIDFIPLEEGDKIDIGNYSFEVISIPGHTPGHIGLYERDHKIFFCGDHILGRITPNITFWGFEQDMLAVYFESLKKVYDYEIDYLFTAHRHFVEDHRKRIDELFKHHEDRLDEIRDIIRNKKMTVRDTAANMKWDLRCEGWDEFPNPQKWFASGEAMAHLEHLFHIGEAERTEESGTLYYKLKKK